MPFDCAQGDKQVEIGDNAGDKPAFKKPSDNRIRRGSWRYGCQFRRYVFVNTIHEQRSYMMTAVTTTLPSMSGNFQ
jgi:hypothetical protein